MNSRPCDPIKDIVIEQNRVLVVEGFDACRFWVCACQAWGLTEIQIINFGGNFQLARHLQALTLASGTKNIASLVIARDAETDADAAMKSIQSAMQSAGLSVPAAPFEFTEGTPRTAFLLQPGFDIDARREIACICPERWKIYA